MSSPFIGIVPPPQQQFRVDKEGHLLAVDQEVRTVMMVVLEVLEASVDEIVALKRKVQVLEAVAAVLLEEELND